MKSKKGELVTGLVWGILIIIIIGILLFSGGAKTLANIGSTIAQIPGPFWVVLGIFVLIKFLTGGKK